MEKNHLTMDSFKEENNIFLQKEQNNNKYMYQYYVAFCGKLKLNEKKEEKRMIFKKK